MAGRAKGNLWGLFHFVYVGGAGGNDRGGNYDSDKGQGNQEQVHCLLSVGVSSEYSTTESSAG